MYDCPIYVIDDDDAIRRSIRDVFESEGFRVECYPNGQQAYEKLSNGGTPCLILLDLAMPVMDGWEFLKSSRTILDRVPIPLWILSAKADPDEAKAAGATGAMRKPPRLESLYELAERYCHKNG